MCGREDSCNFFNENSRVFTKILKHLNLNTNQIPFLQIFRRAGGYGGASGYGGGVGGVEASYTRVTVADGLELTPNLITTRAEEKAALGGLNDRFVTYIEKVRHLVNRNQILEAKVKQVKVPWIFYVLCETPKLLVVVFAC